MTTQEHIALGDGAEFDAIRRMLGLWGDTARGIGDDAAVLAVSPGLRLVASTDATVENVHFRRGWVTAEEIGGRAAAAALSDLAAMAARPIGLLVALTLPPAWHSELEALARGVGRLASSTHCPIVGGNISDGTALALIITVLGECERPLMRVGAREGDVVHVTGRLGGPLAALRALEGGDQPSPLHRIRFATPQPRIEEAAWLALHGATAAIDISDGLAADAAHLARASGVSLVIDAARVPRIEGVGINDALASGEEYELLVTSAPSAFDAAAFQHRFGISLTSIGVVSANDAGVVRIHGADRSATSGHDHLA